MDDGLVVPLASSRDLGCWVERIAASSEHLLLIGDAIFISAVMLPCSRRLIDKQHTLY